MEGRIAIIKIESRIAIGGERYGEKEHQEKEKKENPD